MRKRAQTAVFTLIASILAALSIYGASALQDSTPEASPSASPSASPVATPGG
jgi:hypothetical protein